MTTQETQDIFAALASNYPRSEDVREDLTTYASTLRDRSEPHTEQVVLLNEIIAHADIVGGIIEALGFHRVIKTAMFGGEDIDGKGGGGIVPAIERLHEIGETLGNDHANKPTLAELHKQLGSIQTDLENGAEEIAELAGDYLY